jgi:hypothetical protein
MYHLSSPYDDLSRGYTKYEGKGKIVTVLNEALRREDVLRSGDIAPHIL